MPRSVAPKPNCIAMQLTTNTKSSFTVFSASKVLNGLNAYVRSEEDWHTRAWRCGAGNSGKGVRAPGLVWMAQRPEGIVWK